MIFTITWALKGTGKLGKGGSINGNGLIGDDKNGTESIWNRRDSTVGKGGGGGLRGGGGGERGMSCSYLE